MATSFVKVLTAAIMVGALLNLGAQTATAKGGGGGHGGGGKHVSGGAHVRGAAHIGRANVRGAKSAGVGTSRGKIAHMSGRNARALGATGALGGRAAWNQWGNPYWRNGWNGGWGGWSGPVFWPYFFGNLLAFTFWPCGYYAPLWGYGEIFVWDAIFWPGPYYAYGPAYYDVYGGYLQGMLGANPRHEPQIGPDRPQSAEDRYLYDSQGRLVYQPGMMFTLQMHIIDKQETRGLFLADSFVITPAGPRCLNKFPPQLVRLGG